MQIPSDGARRSGYWQKCGPMPCRIIGRMADVKNFVAREVRAREIQLR